MRVGRELVAAAGSCWHTIPDLYSHLLDRNAFRKKKRSVSGGHRPAHHNHQRKTARAPDSHPPSADGHSLRTVRFGLLAGNPAKGPAAIIPANTPAGVHRSRHRLPV